MQLGRDTTAISVRRCLSTAACVLLATGATATASAQGLPPPADPTWEFDASGLLYGEVGRTNVIEPMARITRLLPGGQMLWAQGTLDAMSGASPSGALPPGQETIETITTASGTTQKILPPDKLPTGAFKDLRGALDLGWEKPLWNVLTPNVSGHASLEKDYSSLGLNGGFSLDLMHHLTTLTAGAGVNDDRVFPVGGTYVQLDSTRTLQSNAASPKQVTTGMLGLSRILTRRWMVGVTASRSVERGFLTEPYKVVSVMDTVTGYTIGQFTEKRPMRRVRQDVLTSSVYHLARDILYLSHRYYWDDWGVRSETFDVKYRIEREHGSFLQPHARLYTQTAASFFTFGFLRGQALPALASSDERLGALRTLTLGATYGFQIPEQPGEFTVRVEYIRQGGNASAARVVGVQRGYSLFPGENIGTIHASYSVQF